VPTGDGTLFLDEIGDLSAGTQAKLLRVLQEKTIHRVGGNETIPVDARVIAATHRNLETMIREGKFREDLFYRLSVATILLPLLRERRDDIPALVEHFLRKCASEFGLQPLSLAPGALALLQADPWPGNIRELENIIRRLILGARGLPISEDSGRRALAARGSGGSAASQSLAALAAELLAAARRGENSGAYPLLLAEAEREILAQAISAAEGNQSKAARWLGIARLTLCEKLSANGLHPEQHSDEVPQPKQNPPGR
jgi:DNA-binding NtrC family response regulator